MSVSVVIPAYRRTYLRQAIASVLTQGFEDFELIIGDDNPGDEVEAVVSEFRDPRLRHVRTKGNTGAVENCRMLWEVASRPLLKYVFDDDLLMPSALVEMVGALQAHPGASFCFSNRYIIDARGLVVREPKATPEGRIAPVTRQDLASAMIANVNNPVGEFTNVLINKASGVTFQDVDRYDDFEIRVLGDVSFYLNATRRGPAVQIGKTLAAFRRHADQNSSPAYNPRFSRGLVEWEIMLRCEYDAGHISPEQAIASAAKLDKAYASWRPQLDELELVQPGIRSLLTALQAGGAKGVTPEFREALEQLTRLTDARWLAVRAAPADK